MALNLYERSVEQDPSYAPAWARLGRLYRVRAKIGHEDRKTGYQRALALNPNLPEAHHLYTALELERGRPTEAMVRLIDQAKRGGADPNLFAGLVQACRYVGLLEASLAAHERARRLEPQIDTGVHHSLWMAGQYQHAIDAAAGKPFSELTTALSFIELGCRTEAIRVFDDAIQSPHFQSADPSLTQCLRVLRGVADGNRDAALAALEQIDFDLIELDPEFLYYVSIWFVPAGAVERGLSLQGGAEGILLLSMDRDALLDPLRTTAEFQTLLAQVEARHKDALAAFTQAGGDEVLGLIPSAGSSSS